MRINTLLLKHSSSVAIPAAVSVNKPTTKIVGFITDSYIMVAMRWYDRLQLLGYRQHVIVCVEPAAYHALQAINQLNNNTNDHYRVEYSPLPPMPSDQESETIFHKRRQPQQHPQSNKSYSSSSSSSSSIGYGHRMRIKVEMLFAHRWHYLLHHLQQGIPILITDVDNIWNRRYDLSHLEKSSPVSSAPDVFHALETKHPVDVFERQGFVVCGGMGWFRPTNATLRYIQTIVQQCGIQCDDQVIVNQVLASPQLGMIWNNTHLQQHQEERKLRNQTESSVTVTEQSDEPNNNNNHSSTFPHRGNPQFFEQHYFERLLGLVQDGFTGVSSSDPSFSVQLWSRAVCYRGRNDPNPCPSYEENWISMPFVTIVTRHQGPSRKLQAFEVWDRTCPNSYSKRRKRKKKKIVYYKQLLREVGWNGGGGETEANSISGAGDSLDETMTEEGEDSVEES